MILLGEILRAIGRGTGRTIEYTIVEGQGGYFGNISRMAEFSAQRIVFCGRRGGVVIEGEALSLDRYERGDAVVRGRILRVEQQ